MAKKSNEEFKNMSVNNILDYTSGHPKEEARTSKILGKATADCLGMYIDDKIESAMKIVIPSQI